MEIQTGKDDSVGVVADCGGIRCSFRHSECFFGTASESLVEVVVDEFVE